MWGIATVLTSFTTTRAIIVREGPEEFLKGYNGYLQADAYRGYDAMFKNRKQNLTEVGCWAHSRRYYFEALTSDLSSYGDAGLHSVVVRN